MRINDWILDVLGNAYRWACGVNDVLIGADGKIVTFEAFVEECRPRMEKRGLVG